jgi:EPS-associated MarR family transcriptional regulator
LEDETRYKLLKLLNSNPELSQREVARELGISLGKVNYCLRSLMQRGWVKAVNFKNNGRKSAYMYLLTRRGIEEKTRVTVRFLQRKLAEYEELRLEIERIRGDADGRDVATRQDDAARSEASS